MQDHTRSFLSEFMKTPKFSQGLHLKGEMPRLRERLIRGVSLRAWLYKIRLGTN